MLLIVPLAWITFSPGLSGVDKSASRNACINNLRQIEGAKQSWSLENKKLSGSEANQEAVAGYIRGGWPVCPKGGRYSVGKVDEPPACSIPGHKL